MNWIINGGLKNVLNFALVVFLVCISAAISSVALTPEEINTICTLDVLKQNIIQYIPHLGEVTDYILSLFGLTFNYSPSSYVSMLAEITFVTILMFVFNVAKMLHVGIKNFADRIAPTGFLFSMAVNTMWYIAVVFASIASAVLLNSMLEKWLAPYGETIWIVLVVVLIVGMAAFAVFRRSVIGIVQFVLDWIVGVANIILIQLTSALMTMADNLDYATSLEEGIIVPILILSLLSLTCYTSYVISALTRK